MAITIATITDCIIHSVRDFLFKAIIAFHDAIVPKSHEASVH